MTLENLGPDELLVAERRSLEALDRSQSQWRFLASLLGGKATDAFVVRENGDPPSLAFATRDRAVVQTVGARIGIAQTNMMVDDSGAYRAALELRVENRTEQVRVTNAGYSARVDAAGRLVDSTDLFVEASRRWTVPTAPVAPETPYTRFGDWLPIACAVATALLLALPLVRRRRAVIELE